MKRHLISMRTKKLRENISKVARLSLTLPLQVLDSVRDSVQKCLFSDDPGGEQQLLASTSAPRFAPAWLQQRRAASSPNDSRLLKLPTEIRGQIYGYAVISERKVEIHQGRYLDARSRDVRGAAVDTTRDATTVEARLLG